MNVWIFQAVPSQYDLRERANLAERKKTTWVASRYRDQMAQGDLVFFWLGGDAESRGVYGWGHLTSKPYGDRDEGYGADVVYDRRLPEHIAISAIKANRTLQNMQILRAPQATNFLLTRDEAKELIGLLPVGERPSL